MPRREVGEQPAHAERHGVHADGGTGDATDFFPYPQRVARPLAPELPAPRLIGDLAAVGLAVHEDVHVLEPVDRIDRHEEGDRLVLTEHVPHRREPQQRVGVSRGGADSLLGFAAVGNVLGKDQPITFLVAIDPVDRLKDVDILVYREPYGGEVAYEPWRRQFRGKRASDSLRVGKEIRGISGATISVHAVTLGVRRLLADLTAWHASGVIR